MLIVYIGILYILISLNEKKNDPAPLSIVQFYGFYLEEEEEPALHIIAEEWLVKRLHGHVGSDRKLCTTQSTLNFDL